MMVCSVNSAIIIVDMLIAVSIHGTIVAINICVGVGVVIIIANLHRTTA